MHRITFQMDYGNAVVMLKPYRKSDAVHLTTERKLIMCREGCVWWLLLRGNMGKWKLGYEIPDVIDILDPFLFICCRLRVFFAYQICINAIKEEKYSEVTSRS